MHGVWDSQGCNVPTKTSQFSQLTRSYSGKARSYEPKALNETMLSKRRTKILTISHTQHMAPTIPTPILSKEKEWGHKKKK